MTAIYTFSNSHVPEIRPFELMSAWDTAFHAEFISPLFQDLPEHGYGFNFPDDEGQVKQLRIDNQDACAWLSRIHSVLALDSEKGAAAALRFLALIECLGTCDWAGHLLQDDGSGSLNIHPVLLRVAARHPLMIGSPFNTSSLHKMLVQDSETGLAMAACAQSTLN